jgi:hypothetical protein
MTEQTEIEQLREMLRVVTDERDALEDCKEHLRRLGEFCGCDHVESPDEREVQVRHIEEKFEELKDELHALREESRWVRRKFGLPEDTPFASGGDKTLAGTLHVIEHRASGYVAYIEAFKCDDKQGEIARQHVEILRLRSENADLSSYISGLVESGAPLRATDPARRS